MRNICIQNAFLCGIFKGILPQNALFYVQDAQKLYRNLFFVGACAEKRFWGIDIMHAPCYNSTILFYL